MTADNKKSMKVLGIMIFFIVAIGMYLIYTYTSCSSCHNNSNSPKNSISLEIGSTKIPIEVADDAESRRLGLSYRESLDKRSGMLFVMPDRQVASFWMKDMNFPLDIIWIDGNKIVNISKNLSPAGSQPKISYPSKYPIDYALEVNAGFCEDHGIEIGDELIFNL